jgi:tetratricopeptide (TPR) repeat protein
MTAVTVGYDNLAADLVWLRAIQYYGEHRQGDLKFEYLGHIFEILTTLDPKFVSAYTFGSLLLADDAKEPERALDLLTKGIRNNPDDWRIPFTKGFICYVFLRDYYKAGVYFRLSSRMKDAPDMTGRFASFSFQRGGDRATALNLWTELYDRSKNEVERVTALRYAKEILCEILDEKVLEFREEFGRYPRALEDLPRAGLLKRVPVAPDGDTFIFNAKRKRVEPASGPLKFGD